MTELCDFNRCEGGVTITEEIVNRLDKERREGYPNCVAKIVATTEYWGQEFQEETMQGYKTQDEEFVNWCREQLKAGKDIAYECSW